MHVTAERLRVLHVLGGLALDWGGPSRVARDMATALAARGHDVTVLTTDVAPGGRRLPLGAPGQPPPEGAWRAQLMRANLTGPPFLSVGVVRELLARADRYDLVHVHGLFNAPVTTGMWALRARRAPFIVRACGMLDPWSLTQRGRLKAVFYRLVERQNLRRARAIQVSTPHEQAAVAALDLGVPIVCLPQGVARLPDGAAEPAPWPRPYLLFLGRVAKKKGLARLIEAMHGRDLDLVVVGPDEHGHAAELRARAPSGRVHFIGPERDDRKKAAWYAHARAFVLPSEDENFGVAVVEAAQQGTPVIVSDQVGLAPFVAADGAGRVVPRDVQALGQALDDVLALGRAPFAEGARRFADRFDWARLVLDLEALYRRVASRLDISSTPI